MRHNNIVKLFLIGIITLLLFKPSFNTYFVQDDFFLLKSAQARNIIDFFKFLIPLSETVWYRPLSSQIFFFLGQLFFGLQVFWWHAVVFITHILTAVLLFHLTNTITKNQFVSVLSAFVYATHWIHVISLSWLAAYSFILGPLFLLATVLFHIHKRYSRAFIFFCFGLLTTEVLIITPLILGAYELLLRQSEKKSFLISLFPYGMGILILFSARFLLFPSQASGGLYTISPLRMLSLLRFYSFRLIGIPMLVDQLPVLTKYFVIISAAILLCGLGYGFSKAILQTKERLLRRQFSFFAIMAFFGISIFLLFPEHISPHYLSFSMVGFAPFVSILILQSIKGVSYKNVIIVILGGIFVLQQIYAINWTYNSHWLFRRADLAKYLIKQKSYVHPVGSEEYYSLGADSAAKYFPNTSK